MKRKLKMMELFMFASFILSLTAFSSCKLQATDKAAKIKAAAVSQAKAEIALAEKAITAGKSAAQTAQEKNTKAKEVKVEDANLIAEALIKGVTDKAEALTAAKNTLANFAPLTGEQIKVKTAALKQDRLTLEAATLELSDAFAVLETEIEASPLREAEAEIEAAEKAITAGKAAAQTAQEKNIKARKVKVEDSKLIAEALIKGVTDKAEALTTAKNTLANFAPLTGKQIKTKAAALKQDRLALETATGSLTNTFAGLDAEIASSPLGKAEAEVEAAEKAITAGKAAAQTAQEKNTKAKAVKVEETKLIAEALIKSVTDKAEALTTVKREFEKLEQFTAEQVKTKTAALKQARLDLEAATANLTNTFAGLDAEIASSPMGKAQAEIALAEKAITAGKTAVKTAQEKNTRAKEVNVEDAKLIAEALINAVTGKAAAVTTAKTGLADIAPLTGVQVKEKTAALKQARLDLEAATANLTGIFAALDAEIAEKEPPMPILENEDGDGNPIVISTKSGKSVSYEELVKFKNKEENKDKILNTEKINITFDVITPSKVSEFFKNFTHLNIDISNETEVISADTREPGADGKPQYFKASELAEVIEKINFVENTAGTSSSALQQISTKASNRLKFEKIKGNIIISDTFSRFEDYELEAFVKDNYMRRDGILDKWVEIPRTKSWITFSQLTKLIQGLKKFEFLNNRVRFGDMLVVNKRESGRDVLNCLDMMIDENIERFELKNTPGEEYSIKFAGHNNNIRCYRVLDIPNNEINVKQLLQISKRCRWKKLREFKGEILDGGFASMSLRFKSINNLNCKKLSADELKDLTFEDAWFSGRFEGEDTDLSDISFAHSTNNAAGVVSFTGVLPRNQKDALYGSVIIRDAELPDIIVDEGIDEYDKLWLNVTRLPSRIENLVVHNLKGLDKICKGLTKKEIWDKFYYSFLHDRIINIGDKYAHFYAGQYIGSEEAYKEFDRLCAFRHQGGNWNKDDDSQRFVCFTDRNNNILKGPYTRTSDKIKDNGNDYCEYVEDGKLTPIPLTNIRQDKDGFFEKVE